MRKIKVLIAPLLEAVVVHRRRMTLADALPSSMNVHHIGQVGIVGRQVRAAAEPFLTPLGQVAEVGMDGRHIRIARMENQRDSRGREGASLAWNLAGEFGRHFAVDLRKIDTRFLEQPAFHHHPASPAPTVLPFPIIFTELTLAIELRQGEANRVLERAKISGCAALTRLWFHFSCLLLICRRSTVARLSMTISDR